MRWSAKARLAVAALLLFSPVAVARDAGPSIYDYDPVPDGTIIGGATLAAVLPGFLDSHLIHVPPSVDPSQVNALDRHVIGNRDEFAGTLSDVSLGLIVALPAAADLADLGWSREYAEDMVVYTEVLAVNSAVTTLFKYAVQRPLPRVYAGTDPELAASPGGYRSFYSGHTSSTFAALSAASFTLGARHHSGAWPWLVTIALGTSIAAERVAAGVHFYTDVAVGAVMGAAVGAIVPALHRRESGSRLALEPLQDGAAIVWRAKL